MYKKIFEKSNQDFLYNLIYLTIAFLLLTVNLYLFYIFYLLSILFLYKINQTKKVKKATLIIPIVFYFIKYLSALLYNKKVWDHLSLGYSNIFMDMRSTIRQIKCQYLDATNLNTVNTVENKICPIFDGYGPLFHQLKVDIININLTTNIISIFSYILILSLAYQMVKDDKYLPIASLLIVSPPVNLLLNQMNIDVIIFMVGIFVLYKENININLRISIFAILIFLKVHPAGALIGFFVYFYKKKSRKLMLFSFLPILLYVFFIFVNPESVVSQQRPTGPYNAFGLLSTGQYIWITFFDRAVGYRLVLIICFFILIILFLALFSNNFSLRLKLEESFFNFGILFWLLLNFVYANYDYRLLLLIFFLIYNLPKLDIITLFITTIYIYLSPFITDMNENIFNFLSLFKTFLFLITFYFLLTAVKELVSEIKFFR